MELTLRKANTLSKSLLETARKLPLNRTVQISVYDQMTPDDTVTAATAELLANLRDAEDLTRAAFELRAAIGETNARCGIATLLTEKAALDARERLVASVAEPPATDAVFTNAVTPPIAVSKLESLRLRLASGENRYGIPEELALKVATAETMAPLKDALLAIRRRKTQIADELLALNTSSKVPVSPFAEELLTRFKLV